MQGPPRPAPVGADLHRGRRPDFRGRHPPAGGERRPSHHQGTPTLPFSILIPPFAYPLTHSLTHTQAALLHARIAEVNRGVHLPRYQEMIQELLRGATAPGTGG